MWPAAILYLASGNALIVENPVSGWLGIGSVQNWMFVRAPSHTLVVKVHRVSGQVESDRQFRKVAVIHPPTPEQEGWSQSRANPPYMPVASIERATELWEAHEWNIT